MRKFSFYQVYTIDMRKAIAKAVSILEKALRNLLDDPSININLYLSLQQPKWSFLTKVSRA